MFEVGDVVQLKSGGPNMTVKEVNETHTIAVWFPANDELKAQAFVHNTVKKV